MLFEAKKHAEECEFSGEGTRGGEEGSGWVRLFSEIYGHMFYYNEKSELKYGLPDGLKPEEAKEIAMDIIVQERVNSTIKDVSDDMFSLHQQLGVVMMLKSRHLIGTYTHTFYL